MMMYIFITGIVMCVLMVVIPLIFEETTGDVWTLRENFAMAFVMLIALLISLATYHITINYYREITTVNEQE